MAIDIGGMRIPYLKSSEIFTEDDLASLNPMAQFHAWFDLAKNTKEILEPNAMCLSTCTKDGFPSCRMVLLKSYGEDGFKFYTNYNSRKGKELTENPRASLCFYWDVLKRSILLVEDIFVPLQSVVRIEGTVERVTQVESSQYFHSRPKASQIGACISPQSQVIPGRDFLTEKETMLKEQYADEEEIPKPDNWGGFVLKPTSIEFWQGQSTRIHDRIRFRKLGDGEIIDHTLTHAADLDWVYERLAP